jgi:hypothetical protein
MLSEPRKGSFKRLIVEAWAHHPIARTVVRLVQPTRKVTMWSTDT